MNSGKTIWVVDDEKSIRWVLEKALTQDGWQVESFESGDLMLARLAGTTPDVLITDIRMPGINGIELLTQVKKLHPPLPVIVMTAHADLENAVSSIQRGAWEYLPKPFEVADAVAIVARAIKQGTPQETAPRSEGTRTATDTGAGIIGKAPAMQEVYRAIGRLGKSNVTVLISGQSGAGKELVAHALHRHSSLAAQAFVPLNMAAIPRDLIESELFGHEKGAFTGAAQSRQGRFEQASGGTLFLDEIGDMPLEAQTRLLRVLSNGEFYRVGGHQPRQARVRIIAATNQNLEQLVTTNRFREDLFHRLNVIRIRLPTLSERREDIPLLAAHFLQAAADDMSEPVKRLKPETLNYLCGLPWPGNVRQLQNVCHWIAVMAPAEEVMPEDLPPDIRQTVAEATPAATSWQDGLRTWAIQHLTALKPGDPGILEKAVPQFERIMIQAALQQTDGHKRDAAILLGWGRNTLTRKIHDLGLDDNLID